MVENSSIYLIKKGYNYDKIYWGCYKTKYHNCALRAANSYTGKP